MYKEKEIVQWAKDKGILDKSNPEIQALKTFEEVGELVSHYLKGTNTDDDMGDIYVTLVIQAAMWGVTLEDCIEEVVFYDKKDALYRLINNAGILVNEINAYKDTSEFILEIIGHMYCSIANITDRPLNECIDIAYSEIVGRTGKMVDGVFVKNT